MYTTSLRVKRWLNMAYWWGLFLIWELDPTRTNYTHVTKFNDKMLPGLFNISHGYTRLMFMPYMRFK
jgi:hypothetical protein